MRSLHTTTGEQSLLAVTREKPAQQQRPSTAKNKQINAVQGKLVFLEWTEHLGDSGNGGTTLEFLSPFLCPAPPALAGGFFTTEPSGKQTD